MESGYAFLHPRNAFQKVPEGLKFEYASIPFSPWRPCLPFLERRILPIGPLALLYRYFRVFWIVVTLPTWIGVVCLFEVFPKAWGDSIGNAWLPRRKSWTRWQRFTYPILARTVWALTFGLPPAASPVTERAIPPLAYFYGRGTDIEPVNLAFENAKEEKLWIQDDAIDPRGKIVPQDYLAGFWIRRKGAAKAKPTEGKGIEVVLYAVGGGYITGHPLEASRVFDIARMSGKPVLGVNYRKAVTLERGYPAGLQDVISAYAFLVQQGYTRIAVAGDSAGAGLAIALMQYLARLSEKDKAKRPRALIMPRKACFYSPWADLTFSHDYGEAVHFDIIHTTMLAGAASAFGTNLINYKRANDDDPESIANLQRAHPYLSPALKTSIPSLTRTRKAATAIQQDSTQFLIFYGGAELFHTEDKALCENLRTAGFEVEEYAEDDETHGFLLVPTFMSPKVLPALERMAAFLGD